MSCLCMINYMATKEKVSGDDSNLIEKYNSEYKRLLKLNIITNKDQPIDRRLYHQQSKKKKLLGFLYVSSLKFSLYHAVINTFIL